MIALLIRSPRPVPLFRRRSISSGEGRETIMSWEIGVDVGRRRGKKKKEKKKKTRTGWKSGGHNGPRIISGYRESGSTEWCCRVYVRPLCTPLETNRRSKAARLKGRSGKLSRRAYPRGRVKLKRARIMNQRRAMDFDVNLIEAIRQAIVRKLPLQR